MGGKYTSLFFINFLVLTTMNKHIQLRMKFPTGTVGVRIVSPKNLNKPLSARSLRSTAKNFNILAAIEKLIPEVLLFFFISLEFRNRVEFSLRIDSPIA